jgi:DNA-binding response OmpR family regulator
MMRILIVEDDVAIATGLQWVLEAEGMTVEVVNAASEVLPAIERCEPDLMLLDLSLADGDGRCVYRELVHRLPIIISTGSFDFVCEHECITVLMKPFTTEQLLNAIAGIFGD